MIKCDGAAVRLCGGAKACRARTVRHGGPSGQHWLSGRFATRPKRRRRVRWCGRALVFAAIGVVASATAAAQVDAAKKANVAISGCLLRQGYATLIVDEARVDGKGDAAATAQPTVAKPGEPLTAPPRWVLDNAGPHTSHVGERVQLVGISDWVTNPDDYPIPTGEPGPAPPAPHIEVISLKVLAPMCS